MGIERNIPASWKGHRKAHCHLRYYIAKVRAGQKMRFRFGALKCACFRVFYAFGISSRRCEAGTNLYFLWSIASQTSLEGAGEPAVRRTTISGVTCLGLTLCILLQNSCNISLYSMNSRYNSYCSTSRGLAWGAHSRSTDTEALGYSDC